MALQRAAALVLPLLVVMVALPPPRLMVLGAAVHWNRTVVTGLAHRNESGLVAGQEVARGNAESLQQHLQLQIQHQPQHHAQRRQLKTGKGRSKRSEKASTGGGYYYSRSSSNGYSKGSSKGNRKSKPRTCNWVPVKADSHHYSEIAHRHKAWWMHIEKCGQSFAYTLVRYSCPGVSLEVLDPAQKQWAASKKNDKHPPIVKYMEMVLGGCDIVFGRPTCPSLQKPLSGHHGLSPLNYGKVVTMFRDPMQRLLSSAGMGKFCNAHWSLAKCAAFKRQTEVGCYVRHINGETCSTRDPGAENFKCKGKGLAACTKRAVQLLQTKFLFVGILERWDESVCLFHAMLGGTPHGLQFKNLHPGTKRPKNVDGSLGSYDAATLGVRTDPYDQRVYDTALDIFNGQWLKHKDSLPSVARCQSLSYNPPPPQPRQRQTLPLAPEDEEEWAFEDKKTAAAKRVVEDEWVVGEKPPTKNSWFSWPLSSATSDTVANEPQTPTRSLWEPEPSQTAQQQEQIQRQQLLRKQQQALQQQKQQKMQRLQQKHRETEEDKKLGNGFWRDLPAPPPLADTPNPLQQHQSALGQPPPMQLQQQAPAVAAPGLQKPQPLQQEAESELAIFESQPALQLPPAQPMSVPMQQQQPQPRATLQAAGDWWFDAPARR